MRQESPYPQNVNFNKLRWWLHFVNIQRPLLLESFHFTLLLGLGFVYREIASTNYNWYGKSICKHIRQMSIIADYNLLYLLHSDSGGQHRTITICVDSYIFRLYTTSTDVLWIHFMAKIRLYFWRNNCKWLVLLNIENQYGRIRDKI